jgi:hypothetical protein
MIYNYKIKFDKVYNWPECSHKKYSPFIANNTSDLLHIQDSVHLFFLFDIPLLQKETNDCYGIV